VPVGEEGGDDGEREGEDQTVSQTVSQAVRQGEGVDVVEEVVPPKEVVNARRL